MKPANRVRPTVLALALALVAALAALAIAAFPAVPIALSPIPLALLLGALLVDWAVSQRPGRLTVKATAPAEIFVGTVAHLRCDIRIGRLPLLGGTAELPMHDGLALADEDDDAAWLGPARGDDTILRVPVGAAGTPATVFPLRATRRGRMQPGPLFIVWRSRAGLLQFLARRPVAIDIAVVPDIRPVTSGAIDLMLQTALFGAKAQSFRGEGSEFHQLTEFTAGMEPRAIDWKRSASAHRLLAKEMRAERNHTVMLAVDQGRLMREFVGGLSKIDHALNAALALAWAAVQHGDKVGCLAFDARPRLYQPPRRGQAAYAALRSRMADFTYGDRDANHVLALTRLHHQLPRRSLVIMLSDFADELSAELIVEHMRVLARRHVVVFATLADPWLARLAAGEAHSLDGVARAVAAERWLAERATVLERMERMGVRVLEAPPGGLTPRIVSTYLDIVAREEV